ncbi:MAG: hypothetical protein HZA34_03510 [Candidatus Pacebacteria bacterium]|nr:hypothetical protein [Candidatus Paceibacterota bacterium]
MTKFDTERLFLFTHSYSGKVIAEHITKRCKDDTARFEREVHLLAKVLRFRHADLKKLIIYPITLDVSIKIMKPDLLAFLEVERELECIASEKLDEYSTAKEDYQRQMLTPAIERVAGNALAGIDDDSEFQNKIQEKIQEHGRVYYKVARKYRLPTMRIVPFLLRLIAC